MNKIFTCIFEFFLILYKCCEFKFEEVQKWLNVIFVVKALILEITSAILIEDLIVFGMQTSEM